MDGADELLRALGERVRSHRIDRALTLRELAERAGVSERFLVLLEGGTANVSVRKLHDIARALGSHPSVLLVPVTSSAPAPAAGLVVALLGLRGAGKSTIGARAARRLGLPFVELDALVAERAGMSPGEIFELHGGTYYRRLEREELAKLLAEGRAAIMATAGGLVTDHESFELLRQNAVTIWLKARPEDHFQRVLDQGDTRPMADRKDARAELQALHRARRALYERAHYVVDTSALGLERSIERVMRIVKSSHAPKPRSPEQASPEQIATKGPAKPVATHGRKRGAARAEPSLTRGR